MRARDSHATVEEPVVERQVSGGRRLEPPQRLEGQEQLEPRGCTAPEEHVPSCERDLGPHGAGVGLAAVNREPAVSPHSDLLDRGLDASSAFVEQPPSRLGHQNLHGHGVSVRGGS